MNNINSVYSLVCYGLFCIIFLPDDIKGTVVPRVAEGVIGVVAVDNNNVNRFSDSTPERFFLLAAVKIGEEKSLISPVYYTLNLFFLKFFCLFQTWLYYLFSKRLNYIHVFEVFGKSFLYS
jgi:hypothetical protein